MSLCALGLLSCPAPTDPTSSDAAIDVVPITEVQVVGDSWLVTLPVAWTQETNMPSGKNVKMVAERKEAQALVLLIKEPYSGTNDQYAIDTIRKYRDQGSTINHAASVIINDNHFVTVKTTNENIIVDSFITVKDGFAYSLECGGTDINASQFAPDCQKIADSLKIK